MSSKRLLFIHGNLDVPASFDLLLPLLPPVDIRCIDLEDDFKAWDAAMPVTVRTVAQRMADAYSIGPDDVLIGHSMGGWIAAHVKELTGATVIQLSSWTDPRKVRAPIRRLDLIQAIVNSGVVQHRYVISIAKRLYPFRHSRTRVRTSLDRLKRMNPAYLFWQYELIFRDVPPLMAIPDLRIHSRRDPVIRPPDEPFVDVPGYHMSHVDSTHQVATAISSFLSRY